MSTSDFLRVMKMVANNRNVLANPKNTTSSNFMGQKLVDRLGEIQNFNLNLL